MRDLFVANSLICYEFFSITGSKFACDLVSLFLRIVTPKYLTSSLIGIPQILGILLSFIGSNSHFLRFRNRPDAFEKFSISEIARGTWESLLRKRVVSLANWLIRISRLAIVIPCKLL